MLLSPVSRQKKGRVDRVSHTGNRNRREPLEWLLGECARLDMKGSKILTDDVIDILLKRLKIPLQFEHYLTLALEEAYKIGLETSWAGNRGKRYRVGY